MNLFVTPSHNFRVNRIDSCRSNVTSAISPHRTNISSMVRLSLSISNTHTQTDLVAVAPGILETETNGVQEGLLIITRSEIRTIFEPVISEVQELVLNQIRDVEHSHGRVAAVLLVGGFGASEYLRKRLQLCVDAEVMQPKNAYVPFLTG